MAPLNLPLGPAGISVSIQPVVLLNICDSYIRRNDGQTRVIGTLLGSITDGVVDIKNCYAVPHNETNDQVAVDINHHKTLYELHQKVNSKEQIVGWYSTGWGVSGSDALIQDFYALECQNPVHVTVDTAMQSGDLTIAAFVARTLALGERALAKEFQAVPCAVRTGEIEKLGVEALQAPVAEKLPSDLESLHATFRRLQESLDQAHAYVQDVVSGRRPADVGVGRQLADAVAGVPHMARAEFEAMLTDAAQDGMLVMYLSNLVRAHLALADKLGTAALPIL